MAFSINNKVTCVTPARPSPSLIARLGRMLAVKRQRTQLRDLDDRMLDDIGVSRAEAQAEARLPAWDAPDFWRH